MIKVTKGGGGHMRIAPPFPLCVDEYPDIAAEPDSTEPGRRRRHMHLRKRNLGRYKTQIKFGGQIWTLQSPNEITSQMQIRNLRTI